MKTLRLATIVAIFCLLCHIPAQADGNYDPTNTMQTLNYAIMSVYRVGKNPSKVTVDEEYSGIINNLAVGNIADDQELKDLINAMMDAYTEEKLEEKDRALLRRQYEVQVNAAFLKVKPLSHLKAEVAANNAERAMQAMRADGLLGKFFASSAVTAGGVAEYTMALQANERLEMQARSEEKEFMQQRLTQEWQLDKEKIRRFNGLQKNLLNASWSLLRRYNLPDDHRLTEETIAAYHALATEKDNAKALRMAKRLEGQLSAYPPYWFYYGKAALASGDRDLARTCFEQCEKHAGTNLRKNQFVAAMARYKLFVIGEKEVDEAKRLLGLIEKHSSFDDWNNILFAALQWYQLGDRQKADDLLLQNIDNGFDVPLHTEIRTQLKAGKPNLAAVQGVAIREFKEPSELEKLAKAGNAEAQYMLGEILYMNCPFGEKSPGVPWLEKAAKQNHLFAQCRLALVFKGKDNEWAKDAATLFKKLNAAQESSAKAKYYIAKFYQDGLSVTKNEKDAFAWYQKAAHQGDAFAQNNLGGCYDKGQGVTKDEAQAVAWYRKAAEQGLAPAQNNLGVCYENGQGVTKDEAQAVAWYRKAAEQGHAYAQSNLGGCYLHGNGVAKDMTQAVQWYRKAAEQGNADAQNNLGVCYETGQGVPKDEAQAVTWYRKAAEQGYANAQYNLGLCYYNGQGVPKDLAQAVTWYRKAAEQGYAMAQNNLGVCYETGQGVAKDLAQAIEWYRKAAEQGHADAQYNLGLCYYNGQGVEQDYIKAVEWSRKAAEQGQAGGQNLLGVCYETGQGVAKDLAQAVQWYKKAAAQGNQNAQKNLQRLGQ